MTGQSDAQTMVSPHSEWDNHEQRFTNEIGGEFTSEEVHITARPVRAQFNGGSALVQSVARGDENGYSIVVEIGTSGDGSHDDIITFGDERTAWEFVHLLPHYFVHQTDPTVALGDLIHSARGDSRRQWVPHRIIEDLSAAEAFEQLLSPYPAPEDMADVLGKRPPPAGNVPTLLLADWSSVAGTDSRAEPVTMNLDSTKICRYATVDPMVVRRSVRIDNNLLGERYPF